MIAHGKDIKIFAGNSNRVLAQEICQHLNTKLGDSEVGKFADGECYASLYESVRGSDVFVIQSTCNPVNDNLMEMLVMIDALKRASAGRITAVIPYFGYARQDRKAKARDPISAKLVANMIVAAGADRVLTMDLHAAQIQGFFDIPVDNLLGNPIFVDYYGELFGAQAEEMVVGRRFRVPRPRFCPETGHESGHCRQAPSQGQFLRGYEHHRRCEGPRLHPFRRYGGHGRQHLQCGQGHY